MATWPSGLGNGLQSRVREFDSRRRLQRVELSDRVQILVRQLLAHDQSGHGTRQSAGHNLDRDLRSFVIGLENTWTGHEAFQRGDCRAHGDGRNWMGD